MKARILTVLLIILSPLLPAQISPEIPARVQRTADILGVRAQIVELAAMRSTPQHDELREMRLVQNLQGAVVAAALDVDSVNARIDYESARLNEVQAYLSARRDRRVNLANLGNLVIGTGVGAVGSGLQLIGPAQHAGNIASTVAGFGGTLLSILGLREGKGNVRAPGFTPAMLAKPLGRSAAEENAYPGVIWTYLTTPDPNLPRGESPQQHARFEWTSFGHIKDKPDEKTLAALTSTGKNGTPLGIDVIGDRIAMLADLRAHVSAMQVDLAELLRFAVAEK